MVESDEGGAVVEVSSSLERAADGDAAEVAEIDSEHGSGDEGEERGNGAGGGEQTNRVDMDLHHLVGPDHEPDPRIGNGGENEAAVLIAAEQGIALMACLAEGGDLARSQLATFGAFDLMSEGAFSETNFDNVGKISAKLDRQVMFGGWWLVKSTNVPK